MYPGSGGSRLAKKKSGFWVGLDFLSEESIVGVVSGCEVRGCNFLLTTGKIDRSVKRL